LTLLEVIVAMAIFLMAMGAIVPLIGMGASRALEVEMQALALQKCQSKMSELMIGAEALSNQADSPFLDSNGNDDGWRYSLDCSQNDISNLWNVQVRVYRQMDDNKIEVSLSQLMLDPSARGGPVPTPKTPAKGGGGGGGGGGSSGGGNNTTTASGGAAGAAAPATTKTGATTTPTAGAKTGATTTPVAPTTVNPGAATKTGGTTTPVAPNTGTKTAPNTKTGGTKN
jgi:type II secretion system protein I